MIHRLAIILGSIAAAVVLGLGLVATGFGPAAAPVDAEQPSAGVAAAPDAALPTPVTRVETRTVYVRPAPKPKVIHVTKRLPAAAPAKHPRVQVIHVTRTAPRGDDDGGREGGDDR